MKISAIVMPSGVNATLMPSAASGAPSQPFGAYSAVSVMPATAVGSANGRSISASTIRRPGKLVAHEHPRDQQAEHGVDARGRERRAERQPVRRDDARIRDRRPRTPPTRASPPATGSVSERNQHDEAQIEQREAHRQPEARQDATASTRRTVIGVRPAGL